MKKNIFSIIIALITMNGFSQSLGYTDLGILFSTDNNYGTARLEAMSGAFGALGGDVSSTSINPAGATIAIKSPISVTLGTTNNSIDASYYGNTKHFNNENFNLSQVGGILSYNTHKKWNKFALYFNYQLKNNFNNNFNVNGNSGVALFNEHPNDATNPRVKYNTGKEQVFSNILSGNATKFNFGFATAYENKLHLGANLNFHNFTLNQTTRLRETNEDTNGNTLNAFNEQISFFEGNGVSLGLGLLYKINQNIRLGLAYETPTFYQEVLENSNLNVFDPNDNTYNDWLGYTKISATNINTDIDSGEEKSNYAYSLKTPSKLTLSTAYVFGKKGLVSIDYSYKNYAGIKYSNGNFTQINQSFTDDFKSANSINIGTEWRFDNFSIRGGYHFEESPLKTKLASDNKQGYSVGLGYNFGKVNIDLAYRNDKYTGFYNIYNTNLGVNSVELNNNNSRILGTLSFSL